MYPRNIEYKGVLVRLSRPIVSSNPHRSVLMDSGSLLLCSWQLAGFLISMGIFRNKAVHTRAHPMQQQAVVLRKIFNQGKLGRLPRSWKVWEPEGKKRQMETEEIGPPFLYIRDDSNEPSYPVVRPI